jgi:hypothetical protein
MVVSRAGLACAAALSTFLNTDAQADNNLAINLFSNPTDEAAEPSPFVEKNIYIVFDASDSQKQVDREAAMHAIIDVLQKPEAATFLDSGNFYRLGFISFGAGAYLEQEIIINNVESAVQEVSTFFLGEDGNTPVTFNVSDQATRLNGAFDIIRADLDANGDNYHETDILVVTDAMLTDRTEAADDMNSLLAAYPKVQIHCGIVDRGKIDHTDFFLKTFVSPQRVVSSNYGGSHIIEA